MNIPQHFIQTLMLLSTWTVNRWCVYSKAIQVDVPV